MSDVVYCPRCASELEDHGVIEEDRHITTCPDCGIVEVVSYQIDMDTTGADRIRRFIND